MNSAILAALFTAVGAVIISVISAIQARGVQHSKNEQDRLALAQVEIDRVLSHVKEENAQLWTEVRALRTENDTLRKRLRAAGID